MPKTTKPHTRKDITMKGIRTSKPGGLPRFIYALLVCALITAIGVGSGIAVDKNSKVTLVYEHALPNLRIIVAAQATIVWSTDNRAHTNYRTLFIRADCTSGSQIFHVARPSLR